MADDKADDQTAKEFSDPDLRRSNGHVVELTKRIDDLERERDGLVNEIAGRKEEIKQLTLVIDGLKEDESKMREKMEGLEREIERSQEAAKTAEAVAARAADLETEVARLQHDSISRMNAAEEARTESVELRRVLGEKESRVLDLERAVEGLKQAKAEIQTKARDLEKKIGVLQINEIEEKKKKIRVEEELRETIDEKDKEIRGIKRRIEELQRVATERGSELEEWIKEKLSLVEAQRESEEKAGNMESDFLKLQEQVVEAEKVIVTLREKAVKAVNGAVNGINSEAKGLNGMKLQWSVVAGSTGAIAVAAAVIYVCYGKRT